jgi:hypothetical protein
MENYFLENKSKIIIDTSIEMLNKSKEIIYYSDKSKISLIYYQFKSKTIDSYVYIEKEKKKRITKNYNELDEEVILIKKIKKSIRPNFNHFVEACDAREIEKLMKKNFVSIHDCSLVYMDSVSDFIEAANLVSNRDEYNFFKINKKKKKYYSFFIAV